MTSTEPIEMELHMMGASIRDGTAATLDLVGGVLIIWPTAVWSTAFPLDGYFLHEQYSQVSNKPVNRVSGELRLPREKYIPSNLPLPSLEGPCRTFDLHEPFPRKRHASAIHDTKQRGSYCGGRSNLFNTKLPKN
jgi:hypothetical protein